MLCHNVNGMSAIFEGTPMRLQGACGMIIADFVALYTIKAERPLYSRRIYNTPPRLWSYLEIVLVLGKCFPSPEDFKQVLVYQLN